MYMKMVVEQDENETEIKMREVGFGGFKAMSRRRAQPRREDKRYQQHSKRCAAKRT